MDDRVSRLAQDSASDLCLSVVSRQVVAIEKGKSDVQAQLEALGTEHGCYRRYDVNVAGAMRPMTDDELRNAAVEARARRAKFEKAMAGIDNQLQLHEPLL